MTVTGARQRRVLARNQTSARSLAQAPADSQVSAQNRSPVGHGRTPIASGGGHRHGQRCRSHGVTPGRPVVGVTQLTPRPTPTPGPVVGIDQLPIAVGFGSVIEVRPRLLVAVPGVMPDAPPLPRQSEWSRPPLHPTPTPTPTVLSGTRPGAEPDTMPLRLTARGRVVLLVVAAALGFSIVVAAWFGASSAHRPAPLARPASVTVHDGDTLWSIATRVAPNHDPRPVVDQLRRINHLAGVNLVPGQVLRTR